MALYQPTPALLKCKEPNCVDQFNEDPFLLEEDDIPLMSEDYVDTAVSSSQEVNNYAINTAGLIESYVGESTYAEVVRQKEAEVLNVGPDAVLEQSVAALASEEIEGITQLIIEEPSLQDQDGIDAGAELIQETLDAKEAGSAAAPKAVVDIYRPDLPELQREARAMQDYGMAILAQHMDDVGLMETILDVGQTLVPGWALKEYWDVSDRLGVDMRDIKNALKVLPAEEVTKVLPTLIDEIQTITGNSFTTGIIVADMLGVSDDNDFEVTLAQADVAMLGMGALYKAVKSLSTIRRAHKLTSEAVAARHTNEILDNKDVMRMSNLEVGDVQATKAPLDGNEQFFAGGTDELKEAVSKDYRERVKAIQAETEQVRFMRDGIMRGDEQALILEKYQTKFDSDPDIRNADLSFDGNRIVGTLTDNEGRATDFALEIDKDSIGRFGGEMKSGVLRNYAMSPSAVFSGLKEDVVGKATVLSDMISTKNRVQLEKAASAAFKGTNAKQKAKIDDILLMGDEKGVVYTIEDLTNGVQTSKGTVVLETPAEISAYYGAREMFDRLHWIKNKEQRRALTFEGYKNQVRFPDKPEDLGISYLPETAIVKEVDRLPDEVAKVWDNSLGRKVAAIDVEEGIARGDLLVLKIGNASR